MYPLYKLEREKRERETRERETRANRHETDTRANRPSAAESKGESIDLISKRPAGRGRRTARTAPCSARTKRSMAGDERSAQWRGTRRGAAQQTALRACTIDTAQTASLSTASRVPYLQYAAGGAQQTGPALPFARPGHPTPPHPPCLHKHCLAQPVQETAC